MIKSEEIGNDLIRHYSDAGKRIRQIETGTVYDETIDIVPCRFTYEETEEPIEEAEASADELLAIFTGESE